MIAGCDRRDAWVGLSPDLKTITSEPTVGKGNTINESEMALFSECMQSCARKVLDTGRHCQRGDVTTATILIYAKSTAFINLPELPPLVGQTISHYRIVEKLGARES